VRYGSNAKIRFQSVFMLTTTQPSSRCLVVERLRNKRPLIAARARARMRTAGGVVVQQDHREPRTVAGLRVLEIAIADRVSERQGAAG
jgi:hypothetical protein